MPTRKSKLYLPNPSTNNQELHHLETEVDQIEDMSSYMKGISKTINNANSLRTEIGAASVNDISNSNFHLLRQNSMQYAVGDIAFSASMPSNLVLECTAEGTTASTEPDFSGATDGGTKTDNTVVWKYRKIIPDLSVVPVGAIVPYGGSGTPSGYLLCDGSAVSRSTYSALYSAIGTTWGTGNGSTTFNLPNISDRVLQGVSATHPVGTYMSAGLPNIKGSVTQSGTTVAMMYGSSSTSTGALSTTSASKTPLTTGSGSASRIATLDLDASKSNSIYGNSTTVQPSAACGRFMIKY